MRAAIYWLWDLKDFRINLNRRCAKLKRCREAVFGNYVEGKFRLSTFFLLVIIFIIRLFQSVLWEQVFFPQIGGVP